MKNTGELEVLYFQVTDLWRRLCEEHSALLDCTFDEYSLLLSSDMEGLENKIAEKAGIIKRIGTLEALRAEIIVKLSTKMGGLINYEIQNVSDLLRLMRDFEDEERESKHLERFNALLIDIINKIQEQNKKNQLFINKAIHSLQTIREDATGKKSYSTYTAKGSTTNVTSG